MNNIETVSALDTNLLTALTPVILSALTFIYKWLKKMPDNDDGYFSKAGVSPYELKLSMSRFDFWKTKPITRNQKIGYSITSLFLIIFIGVFMFFGGETIKKQPDNWASLVLIKTKENFLLTYDEAKNFPGERPWKLSVEDCYKDTYDNLATHRKISANLTYSICSRIGLNGERKGIEERIKASEKNKKLSLTVS
ncbi:DUF6216 family protein [Pantoea rwandensis]|uniref:Uncharacterized protein n=1 Tax=Pantoea rwandensis TaxID=1076550 RepID=A0A1X1CXI3_9GAMM|nr:DUF6216 family protein [Pantoea rwandensis]ORM69115.1 hypothetical protein HA51_12655 [Pantoea rwandensis]